MIMKLVQDVQLATLNKIHERNISQSTTREVMLFQGTRDWTHRPDQ